MQPDTSAPPNRIAAGDIRRLKVVGRREYNNVIRQNLKAKGRATIQNIYPKIILFNFFFGISGIPMYLDVRNNTWSIQSILYALFILIAWIFVQRSILNKVETSKFNRTLVYFMCLSIFIFTSWIYGWTFVRYAIGDTVSSGIIVTGLFVFISFFIIFSIINRAANRKIRRMARNLNKTNE